MEKTKGATLDDSRMPSVANLVKKAPKEKKTAVKKEKKGQKK